MKVYISGKITGLPLYVAKRNFYEVEKKLIEHGVTEIFNPMKEVDPNLPYEEQMDICLAALETCHCILMQNNWNESPGAKREFIRAGELRLHIRRDTPADYDTFKTMIQKSSRIKLEITIQKAQHLILVS